MSQLKNDIFKEFHRASLGKAATISPFVHGVTLGPNAITKIEESSTDAFFASPQLCSTPIKTYPIKKTTGDTMRRPKQTSTYFELKSTNEAQLKTLMNEVAKKQMMESDEAVVELEAAVKLKEKEVLNKLSLMYNISKTTRYANRSVIEETLLQRVRNIGAFETERDKIAETKALQRSEKLKQNVEVAKQRSLAMQEKRKMYEWMTAWQIKYTAEYQNLVEILKTCKNTRALQNALGPLLKNLADDVSVTDNLRTKVQIEDLTLHDLETASIVMNNLTALLRTAEREAQIINDAVAEQEQNEKKVNEERVTTIKEEATERKSCETATLSDCFHPQSLKTFVRLREHLSKVQETLDPLLKDPNMRNFRFELQKAVTVPVNAISPVSASHMMDKYRKLHHLLSGRRLDGTKGVNSGDHPLGDLFIKDVLAKLFVRQGEMTISSKPEAAFAVASILVNLWTEFPDFGELVQAHFFKQCPYLAPVFLPQLEGQTDEEYYKSLGYLIQDGVIEKQEMFLKRMKGIMRLYAAVLITKPRDPSLANPLGLMEGWRWLAAVLNLEPRLDTCAVLILEMLDVVGNDLLLVYGMQFKKMLAYICKEYFPRLDVITTAGSRGPLTRLQTFLEKVAKEGTIRPPAQRLPPNFW